VSRRRNGVRECEQFARAAPFPPDKDWLKATAARNQRATVGKDARMRREKSGSGTLSAA
jgi:hypothetical protein